MADTLSDTESFGNDMDELTMDDIIYLSRDTYTTKDTYIYSNNSDTITLGDLPDDIYRMILSSLDKTAILSMRRVSKNVMKKVDINTPNNIVYNVNKKLTCLFNSKLVSERSKSATKKVITYNIPSEYGSSLQEILVVLPKSIFFTGRLIFGKLNITLKQLEVSSLRDICGGYSTGSDTNKLKYFNNLVTLSIGNYTPYQMLNTPILRKIKYLKWNLNLYKNVIKTTVIEGGEAHKKLLENPNNIVTWVEKKRLVKDGINSYNVIEYYDLDHDYSTLNTLNMLPNIKTLKLTYRYLPDSVRIRLPPVTDVEPIKHITKLIILVGKPHKEDIEKHSIRSSLLNKFVNLKSLKITQFMYSDVWLEILAMTQLEELHLDLHSLYSYDERLIYYKIFKRLRILTISMPILLSVGTIKIEELNEQIEPFCEDKIQFEKLEILNIYNGIIGNIHQGNIYDVEYDYTFDIVGNHKQFNLIDMPNIKECNLNICVNSIRNLHKIFKRIPVLNINVLYHPKQVDNEYMHILPIMYSFHCVDVKKLLLLCYCPKDNMRMLTMFPNVEHITLFYANNVNKHICDGGWYEYWPYIMMLKKVKTITIYNIDENVVIYKIHSLKNILANNLPHIKFTFKSVYYTEDKWNLTIQQVIKIIS
jgi:hypothetical protein